MLGYGAINLGHGHDDSDGSPHGPSSVQSLRETKIRWEPALILSLLPGSVSLRSRDGPGGAGFLQPTGSVLGVFSFPAAVCS
ncbi:hypothetical protein AVEN_140955-1 [Araneus ventricosus]|uniref:Uncharacterized protein n=1 Tax=Araneus ventricosus TaxID=182803 RepID=A0A4Y2GFQ6_ARAVE|nr:hypothetical protein AVEN_140955-1 [Araneus ventricosus]